MSINGPNNRASTTGAPIYQKRIPRTNQGTTCRNDKITKLTTSRHWRPLPRCAARSRGINRPPSTPRTVHRPDMFPPTHPRQFLRASHSRCHTRHGLHPIKPVLTIIPPRDRPGGKPDPESPNTQPRHSGRAQHTRPHPTQRCNRRTTTAKPGLGIQPTTSPRPPEPLSILGQRLQNVSAPPEETARLADGPGNHTKLPLEKGLPLSKCRTYEQISNVSNKGTPTLRQLLGDIAAGKKSRKTASQHQYKAYHRSFGSPFTLIVPTARGLTLAAILSHTAKAAKSPTTQ